MMFPTAIFRMVCLGALGLLVTLAACGDTANPAVIPVDPTATVSRSASPTVPAPTAGATATAGGAGTTGATHAAPPTVTATGAAMTATPAAGDRQRGTVGTPTARAAVVVAAATAVPPTATPRGYAPDDPCTPYAAGTLPPFDRAVAAAPARLCIPALALSAPIVPVGVTAAGTMAEPDDPRAVGWYAPGPPPGAIGNAALAGKVDVRGSGPGIFWDLAQLWPGDGIVIVDRAGTALRFVVLETAVYRRAEAPLTRIFGPADDANLALITGAGTWEPTSGAYDSNLIVFARLQP